METSLRTGFAQIFSRCPKNLSCPKFGGAAAPLAPPARTPMPLVSEKILDEKHQTGFPSMVHSYHIPDTLSDKDVPVVTTREDNLPKYKLLFKIILNLLKMLFYLSNNKFMQWELAC